jgi:hypothetical protein
MISNEQKLIIKGQTERLVECLSGALDSALDDEIKRHPNDHPANLITAVSRAFGATLALLIHAPDGKLKFDDQAHSKDVLAGMLNVAGMHGAELLDWIATNPDKISDL